MQQVELGHIDLSQDIHTYLSDGFLKNIQYETPITMLHLMNHTAGLQNSYLIYVTRKTIWNNR